MDYQKLRELLHYDPETGVFTWLKRPSQNTQVGSVAGTDHGRYFLVRHKYKGYLSHRLAWLYMTGSCPPEGKEIDHIDGDGHNNKWANLRLATHRENAFNRKSRVNSTSKWKGVSWNNKNQKWVAQICSAGKNIRIGFFDDEREAAEEYIFKALELHGDYARFL